MEKQRLLSVKEAEELFGGGWATKFQIPKSIHRYMGLPVDVIDSELEVVARESMIRVTKHSQLLKDCPIEEYTAITNEYKYRKNFINGFIFTRNEAEVKIMVKATGCSQPYIFDISPTGNCQLFSIKYLDHLMLKIKCSKDIWILLDHCSRTFLYNKRLFLFDIQRSQMLYLLKIPHIKILNVFDYTSTNGSYMKQGLARIEYFDDYLTPFKNESLF